MITTNGQIIDMNDKTEWILFQRLSKKVHPVDLLSMTDSIIEFPNFLFTASFLILIFLDVDFKTKFMVPASLYFCGQILINLRIGAGIFRLLNLPLIFFRKFSVFIMAGIFIGSYFFLSWWGLLIIPSWLLAQFLSILIMTFPDRRYYRKHWDKNIGPFQIYRNNAFILAYKYFAAENSISSDISPTSQEINDKDWLKPYEFMRVHWKEIESHFNKKAKVYWRMYLNL